MVPASFLQLFPIFSGLWQPFSTEFVWKEVATKNGMSKMFIIRFSA